MSPTGPEEPFTSNDFLLVRRNRLILGLAASPIFAILGLAVAAIVVTPAFLAPSFHLLALGVVALAYAWKRNWSPVIESVPVRATAGGVRIGARLIHREEISAGFIMPGPAPKVLLRRKGLTLPVELQANSTDHGRALLRALGLDASQTVAHFRGMSQVMAKRRYGVAAGMGFGGFYLMFITAITGAKHHPAGAVLAGVLFATGLITFLTLMLARTHLDVGADGIAIRWLWQKRFIGYDEISVVGRYDKGWGRSHVYGISIILRSGETIYVPLTQGTWGDTETPIVEERIAEAMAAFRTGGAAADAALLRRGERAVGDWVSMLRSIGAGANADMRTAPVPRERLFRIVEDPSASASDRAAAAVALGADLDDDGRARLRLAADATAAPKLRIAIEKAAGGSDEAEMEAALAEIEGEPREARA